ncbi:hypothetical protein ACJJTC_005163 [Scirpophaga incertulas]
MGLEDDISDIKSKLKELSLRRSSIKGQLTKFKNYLVTLESIQLSSIQVAELSLKVKKIELLSTTFDKIQNEVEIINHTNLEYELTERDIIESDIITCIAKANSFIEEASYHSEARRKSLVNETSCQHHVSENIGFKLPQIVISKFDGRLSSPTELEIGKSLFPGPVGISRVADILTTRGCVRRPLVRLCPLPTAQDLQG